MRLSFAQIARLFEGFELNEESWLRRFRLVAYETWRKGSKNAPDIEKYMPIGKADEKPELSKEQLDEVWKKYGKLDRNKKRIKLFRKNVTART